MNKPNNDATVSHRTFHSRTRGLVVILIGVFFLFKNYGLPLPHNWWALFIAIGSVACFGSAWACHKRGDRDGARGSIVAGTTLLTVCGIFLLELDWAKVWPVFLLIAGLAIVIFPPEKRFF